MDKNNEFEKDNLNEPQEESSDSNDQLIQDILNAKHSVHNAKKQNADVPEANQTSEPDAEKRTDSSDDSAKVPSAVPEEEKLIAFAAEKAKRKKKKRSHTKFYMGLILATIIVIISAFLAIQIIKVGKEVLGIGKSDTAVDINIPVGSTTVDIANILVENDLISEPLVFRVLSKLRGADAAYKEGVHTLAPSMSYDTMIIELKKETPRDEVEVTFPEGYTLQQCAELLESSEVCSADDFIYAFNSASFGFDFEAEVTNNSLKFYKMEGFLFPDTYRFFKESDPQIVAKKIYANFDAKIDNYMLGRMKDLNMTLEETIILASIVQAEAPVSYEMKNVASVFYNRMHNTDIYPLLQSDPTTKYVNQTIKPNIEVPDENMFIAYDTYKAAGLPPGAIGNPGLDAIEAVLSPNDTDYFYFCSNLSTREFFYAVTLSEHERNLVKAGLVN